MQDTNRLDTTALIHQRPPLRETKIPDYEVIRIAPPQRKRKYPWRIGRLGMKKPKSSQLTAEEEENTAAVVAKNHAALAHLSMRSIVQEDRERYRGPPPTHSTTTTTIQYNSDAELPF